MSEHYFSKTPQSNRSPETWQYHLRHNTYQFTSDAGVFSKHSIDFGTALLIESFTRPDVPGDLLDVGCGYGPIGISLAALFEDHNVVMIDINERAISLAKHNAEQNNIHHITVKQSDGLTEVMGEQFSAVVTNPPIRAGKDVIYQMFTDAKEVLQVGGTLWIVIQKKQGAPSAKKKLQELFGHVEEVARKKGYFIFKATKFDS